MMTRTKKYLSLLCVSVMGLAFYPSASADEGQPGDLMHVNPHFVEAITEARRRLAIIEPLPVHGGLPIPIATGLFVTEDGGVITSITAVAGAEKIFVKRLRDRRHRAHVKAVDQGLGIVFLETTVTIETPFKETLRPAVAGEWVIAAYAAPTRDNNFFEMGVFPAMVTSTEARIKVSGRICGSLIKLSSKSPEGSATAPVFNSRGELEGLVIAVRECSVASECSYVLPAGMLEEAVEKLAEGISSRIAWLGIALQATPEPQEGVKIAATMQDGPAFRAGLEPGDVILSVDGEKITEPDVLLSRICSAIPGDIIELTVQRNGETMSIPAELESRPLLISTTQTENTRPEDQ